MAKKRRAEKVPDKGNPWNVGKFMKSFVFAFVGIKEAFRNNRNMSIQAVIAVIIIAFSAWLRLTPLEMALIVSVSFLVLILEAVNTAFEKLIDAISPGYNREYGVIKDILAGAVLMASIMAVIIGVLIIGPPIFRLLNGSADYAGNGVFFEN